MCVHPEILSTTVKSPLNKFRFQKMIKLTGMVAESENFIDMLASKWTFHFFL